MIEGWGVSHSDMILMAQSQTDCRPMSEVSRGMNGSVQTNRFTRRPSQYERRFVNLRFVSPANAPNDWLRRQDLDIQIVGTVTLLHVASRRP